MPITRIPNEEEINPTSKQKVMRYIKHVKTSVLKVKNKLFIEDPVLATDRLFVVAVLLMSAVMEIAMSISLGWYLLTTTLIVMIYKQKRIPKKKKKKKE